MNHVGEADSCLKEVVPGIAFPLTAFSELLKYLPSLLGAYIKAGKLLLQAYYSFTSKHCLPPHLAALKDGSHRQFAAAIQAPFEQERWWEVSLGAPQTDSTAPGSLTPDCPLGLALPHPGPCMKVVGPLAQKEERASSGWESHS